MKNKYEPKSVTINTEQVTYSDMIGFSKTFENFKDYLPVHIEFALKEFIDNYLTEFRKDLPNEPKKIGTQVIVKTDRGVFNFIRVYKDMKPVWLDINNSDSIHTWEMLNAYNDVTIL